MDKNLNNSGQNSQHHNAQNIIEQLQINSNIEKEYVGKKIEEYNDQLVKIQNDLNSFIDRVKNCTDSNEFYKSTLQEMSYNLEQHIKQSKTSTLQATQQDRLSSLDYFSDDSQDDLLQAYLDQREETELKISNYENEFNPEQLLHRIEELKNKIKQIDSEKIVLLQQLNDLNAQHQASRYQNETLNIQNDQLIQKNQKLTEQLEQNKNEIEELELQLKESNQTIFEMQYKHQLQQQNTGNNDSFQQMEKEYNLLKQQYERQQIELQTIKNSYIEKQKECDSKTNQISILQQQFQELNIANQRISQQERQIENFGLDDLELKRIELQNEIDRLYAQKIKLEMYPNQSPDIEMPEDVQNSEMKMPIKEKAVSKKSAKKITSKKGNQLSEELKVQVKDIVGHYYNIIYRQKKQIQSYIEENKSLKTKYQLLCAETNYIPQ